MWILIEPTDEIVTLDGVTCRLWEGLSDGGVACAVAVYRVIVEDGPDAEVLSKILLEQAPPVEIGRVGPYLGH